MVNVMQSSFGLDPNPLVFHDPYTGAEELKDWRRTLLKMSVLPVKFGYASDGSNVFSAGPTFAHFTASSYVSGQGKGIWDLANSWSEAFTICFS